MDPFTHYKEMGGNMKHKLFSLVLLFVAFAGCTGAEEEVPTEDASEIPQIQPDSTPPSETNETVAEQEVTWKTKSTENWADLLPIQAQALGSQYTVFSGLQQSLDFEVNETAWMIQASINMTGAPAPMVACLRPESVALNWDIHCKEGVNNMFINLRFDEVIEDSYVREYYAPDGLPASLASEVSLVWFVEIHHKG